MRLAYKAFLLANLTYFSLSVAFGQTVSMDLTGVNGQSYAGVYTSPYYATVNGMTNTPIICDDFSTESTLNETWTANVTNVSGVTSAKFSGANVTGFSGLGTVTTQQAYDAVASLATTLLGLGTSGFSTQQAIIYSFAIWDIFDHSDVNAALSSSPYLTQVNQDALSALQASYTAGEYSDVWILSSTTGTPQEFIYVGPNPVSTPEASSVAILGVDMLAVGAIIFLFRRRAFRTATKPCQTAASVR